jgi:hypothetical protein
MSPSTTGGMVVTWSRSHDAPVGAARGRWSRFFRRDETAVRGGLRPLQGLPVIRPLTAPAIASASGAGSQSMAHRPVPVGSCPRFSVSPRNFEMACSLLRWGWSDERGRGRAVVLSKSVAFLTKPSQTDYIGTNVDAFLPLPAEGMAVQWPKVARHGRNLIPYRC